jgi:hypothetical protein
LIQLYITLEGTLSSWVAKIATGALLLFFIGAQKLFSQSSFGPRLFARLSVRGGLNHALSTEQPQ